MGNSFGVVVRPAGQDQCCYEALQFARLFREPAIALLLAPSLLLALAKLAPLEHRVFLHGDLDRFLQSSPLRSRIPIKNRPMETAPMPHIMAESWLFGGEQRGRTGKNCRAEMTQAAVNTRKQAREFCDERDLKSRVPNRT